MGADNDALLQYAQWVLEPQLPQCPVTPRSSYVIGAIPRSGSWLLSGLLHSTGAAGRPHEYFLSETEAANRRNWGVSSPAEYLAKVLEAGTTDNGVFGCKVMWGVLPHFLRQLKPGATAGPGGDRALIAQFLPRARFVWARRQDVEAQAVSWAKAAQSGYWHHWDSVERHPRFDFAQIDALVRETTEHDAAWRRWFAANEIDPLEVRFEDLVEDMEGQTRRVLRFIGIERPESYVVTEQTVKAGDARARAVNDEWLARYRLERERPGHQH